jgi:hypothetical protein
MPTGTRIRGLDGLGSHSKGQPPAGFLRNRGRFHAPAFGPLIRLLIWACLSTTQSKGSVTGHPHPRVPREPYQVPRTLYALL